LQREAPQGVIVGIRRDEQATRAKERIFSPRSVGGTWDVRSQPPELWGYYTTDVPHGAHVRVHPLLHWTEVDIWRYIGEKNITVPIKSDAASIDEIIAELAATREPERAGRVMDRESEDSFERLRTAGYM
jgi:sulfate adenylyltransferase subunit 2